ncbi:MAG: class I SAM-dependent methyltransferase, partial [Candidatus Kariarchaeaceae archaeon]
MEDHWNDVYSSKPQETLGWYQEDPQPDLAMILSLQMPKSSRIVIAGCGTTTIIEHLIQEGYTNLVLVDLSEVALQILAKRFSNYNFEYIAADLGSNEVYHKIYGMAIELWYDRATLHFLTGDEQIANYRKNI